MCIISIGSGRNPTVAHGLRSIQSTERRARASDGLVRKMQGVFAHVWPKLLKWTIKRKGKMGRITTVKTKTFEFRYGKQSRTPVPLFQYSLDGFKRVESWMYSTPESHDGWACPPTWTAGFLKALQTESARRPWQRVVFLVRNVMGKSVYSGKFRLPITAICHLDELSSFTAELGMLFPSSCSIVATLCTKIHFVLVHPVYPPER